MSYKVNSTMPPKTITFEIPLLDKQAYIVADILELQIRDLHTQLTQSPFIIAQLLDQWQQKKTFVNCELENAWYEKNIDKAGNIDPDHTFCGPTAVNTWYGRL